jgi:hypothetical protein
MSQPPAVGETPEARAKTFREYAKQVIAAGNLEYAIELLGAAIAATPGDVTLHQELREVGLRRKAAGGAVMSLFGRRFAAMLEGDGAELAHVARTLAYDPGNTAEMAAVLALADKTGLTEVGDWIGEILRRANQP